MLNRQPTKAHLLVNPPEALGLQPLCSNPRLVEGNLRAREGGRSAVSTSAEATTTTTAAATTTTETTTSATTTTATEAATAATTATTATATEAAAAVLGLAASEVETDSTGHATVADRGTVLGLKGLLGLIDGAEADVTETLEVTAVTVGGQ